MALTVEAVGKLAVGQKLLYLGGAYLVEFVEQSLKDTDGSVYVKVLEVRGTILHLEAQVGDKILASPSELSWS